MNALLAGVLPVFGLIALGYFLKASGFLPLEQWRPVERLSIHVLYPGFLVPAIWGADLHGGSAGAAAAGAVSAVLLLGIAVLAFKPLMKVSGPTFTSIFQGVLRWNAFVFLPVIQAAYGPTGLALAAVVSSAMIPVINVMCVLVLVRWGEGQGGASPKGVALAIVKNPILVSCFAGLSLNLLGVPPLPGLSQTLELLGDAALSTGLMIAGAGLSFRDAAARPATLGLTCAVKLLIAPPLMWFMAGLWGADPRAQAVALLCGASPGAAASYILARQMGGDAPLIAGVVAFTTAVSAVTIPILLVILHAA